MLNIHCEMNKLAEHGLTAEIINALRKYYSSFAFVSILTPISESYYQKAFELYNPVVVPFIGNDGTPHPECDGDDLGQPITQYSDLYKASNEHFKAVSDYHNNALRADGFSANEGLCPFLVAQYTLRESTRELVDIMEKYTGIGYLAFKLTEERSKYVSLLLGTLGCITDSHNIEINNLY